MSFNLLIVDDEAPIRKGLSEHIKWEDYDCKVVATANNGEDAIAKINENVINII
jgi:two-component system response regulator YesN